MLLTPRDHQILRLAVPSIVSNVTVPLLSLVDLTIAGHFGAASYIGAIAVGSMMLNMIYWIFGFLRMGTSGLTSQAYGRQRTDEMGQSFFRAVTVAAGFALCLIVLQQPILFLSHYLIDATPEVWRMAGLYFHILIWGAPAMLGLYCINGWLVGMQNSRYTMVVALVQNLLNIGLSLFFVCVLGWKIEGCAAGTLLAQYVGLGLGLYFCRHHFRPCLQLKFWRSSFARPDMRRFFGVNRDIFLRTLCLVAVTTCFTAGGAAGGEVVLAVNALLMQLFMLFSYVMDGFAYTGEALGGRYFGAADEGAFRAVVRRLFGWGVVLAVLFTLIYSVGGSAFLRLLTNDMTVVGAAATYFPWAVAIPLVSFSAFLLDGIYVGTTSTRPMLVAMVGAMIGFFVVELGLRPWFHNHALWAGFLLYLGLRGGIEALYYRKVAGQIARTEN